MSKLHRFIDGQKNGFGISPHMQELMALAGHMDCYARCEEILERFTSVKVNPSQVYRVTDHVSESLRGEDGKQERTLQPVSEKDTLYVLIDGSYVLTRNAGEAWKEVKLGRLFKGSDCYNPNTKGSFLEDSQYVGHLGTSKDFCEKLKRVIDSYGDLKRRLVFISDGAAWIREWIADNYPDAVSVLDYYHALEHLYGFAAKAFADSDSERKEWCDLQRKLLLDREQLPDSNVESVLENIRSTHVKEKDRDELITYYQNNKRRMNYWQYRKTGCGIIGSGAIESAHRTVIQKRMKLSGQRWSVDGATNMLRLRVISKNRQWSKVIDFLKTPQLARCA